MSKDIVVPETPQDMMQIKVTGERSLLDATLKQIPGIDFGCRGHFSTLEDGSIQTTCFVPANSLPRIQATTGLTVKVIRNATVDGRARQAEVIPLPALVTLLQGKGTLHLPTANANPKAVLSAYIDTATINPELGVIAKTYPALCQQITLPNQTVQGNTVTMLRVGKQGTTKTKGVLFTACAHAREWGGADICINFILDLLLAYEAGGTIIYGSTTFTSAQVKQIVETVDLFVLPCINPDGRNYSIKTDPLWRKNRNGPGVDCNRNYDFLWDIDVDFDPSVLMGLIPPASDDPNSDVYHGTAPLSEAECRNVVWVLDNFPSIGWMLDIHSFNGDVLYSWGDAPDQTAPTETYINFMNPAYNLKRGVPNPAVYGEYLPLVDILTISETAVATAAAVKAVRGQNYVGKQAFELYGTSGAVDDYSYSRHFAQLGKPLVYGFTLEYGLEDQTSEALDFHPASSEMNNIIADVDAGLMKFCLFHSCATLEVQSQNLSNEIESLQQAAADGEIPQPRTPANIAAFAKEMRELTIQLVALNVQLKRCKAAE